MYQLSDRCEILRNSVVNDKPYSPIMCGQREFYFTKGLYDVPKAKGNNTFLIASEKAFVM